MSARKYKRWVMKRMTNEWWTTWLTRMYHIRYVKPCKTYSCWCADCNAVLFKQEMGRFPYSLTEFDNYENEQQKGKA
jgi:hypothetical protein